MEISFVVPTGSAVNEARDRFLAACMNACWHESTGETLARLGTKGYICTRCGAFYTTQNDFSMPEDFLKLYEWARNNENLDDFIKGFRPSDLMDEKKGPRARKKFADGLYKILSSGEDKK